MSNDLVIRATKNITRRYFIRWLPLTYAEMVIQPLTVRIIKINRDDTPWHRVKVEIAIPNVEEVG